MNIKDNTTALQAVLATVNALPEAGNGGITPSGTIEITENGTYDVTAYASAEVDVAAAGGAGEINMGTCNVAITVPSSSNYYICRETVSAGAVSYAISRSYTSGTVNVTARCDSVMYIQASTIKGAEITSGELLKLASGYGVAYRTPSTAGVTAQVTLTA